MRVVIDRIEDGIATLELDDGTIINAPAVLFSDCREGDVVDILPNAEITQKKKKEAEADLKNLFDN